MSRVLFLLAAVFLVSTAALFAHRALTEATPVAIAAWRLGLASLFFLAWEAIAVPRGRFAFPCPPRSGTPVLGHLLLAGLCLALHFLAWFTSLQYTPIARATLLVCTTPLWTTLGNLLLKRRSVSRMYWLALALAAGGIWLVTQAGTQPPTRLTFRGDVLALAGGALFAGYLLAVEGLHQTVSSRRQVTVTYTAAALVLWVALLAHGGVTIGYSAGVWSAILGMTLGPQIFGHTLLNWSLRHFPSSTVAFSILLEPVLTALLAWVLLHQTVTAGQMAGGLLVLIGLGIVIAQHRPAERVELEPVG